jgi:hypothetical protein
MSVTTPTRRRPLLLSIPAFGLFSFTVVFFFTLVYLNVAFPDTSNNLPAETGELSGWLVASLISLSAGMSAALSGMLSWGFLIVRPWQWLQTRHWGVTALFGVLIGLIEIIFTSFQTWLTSFFLLLLFLFLFSGPPPGFSIGHSLLLLLLAPLGCIWLAFITLVILAVTTKGLVFLGGVAAGAMFALLARRVFS